MRLDSRIIALVFVFALLSFPNVAEAQCAMCRAVLENSDETDKAAAVNDGIVYLMAIPYVLVGVAGFFVYRLYTKKKA